MIVHSALNGLLEHDGVSGFCLLFEERCRELGIENRIYAESVHPSLRHRARPLAELAFASDPDDLLIWHFFNESPGVHLSERFPGRRVLFYHNITPHGFFPKQSPVWRECFLGREQLRSLTRSFELAVGQSAFTRAELDELGFSRTGVFPLFSKFDTTPSHSPASTASASDPWTFVSTCRVAPNKNIEESIEIVAALQQRHPARLRIVGNTRQAPEYAESLQSLAERRNVNLAFLGGLSNKELEETLRAADGYLCTSRHEGFCLPLLETMALGTPVFAVPRTAIAETLGGAGVALPADSPAEAALQIAGLLQDPAQREAVLQAQANRLIAFTREEDRRRVGDLLAEARATEPLTRTARNASVSVVISTWNRADHLESCLLALRRQRFERFEVIVVNGPSTDHTEELLKRIDGGIKVRRTPVPNLCISRNLGLAAASGDFVAFLDDDAIAHPDWLGELLPAFDDPLTAAAGGQTHRLSDEEPEFANGILTGTAFPLPIQPRPGACHSPELRRFNTVTGNNCIFRRDALLAIGGFDERLEYSHDEADVVLRLAARNLRTRHRPLAIVHHGSQPSENRRSEFDLNWPAILKNSIYCGVKNRPTHEAALPFFLRAVREHALRRMSDPWDWWKYGRVPLSLFFRIERRCLLGIAQGIAKSLFRKPRYLTADMQKPEAFLPFATTASVADERVVHVTANVPFRKQNGEGNRSTWLARALEGHGYLAQLLPAAETPFTEMRSGIRYHFVPGTLPNRVRPIATQGAESGRMFSRACAVWEKMSELAVRCGARIAIAPLWESEALLVAEDPRFQSVPIVITPVYETMRIEGQVANSDMRRALGFERRVLERAAAVVGISETTTREVLGHYGIHPTRQALIPIGIPDCGEVSLAPPSPMRLLYIGPFNRRKGVHILLESLAHILEEAPTAYADIAGELPADAQSPMGELLEAWKRKHAALLPRVAFHGPVDERRKQQLFSECTLLLMPSLYESFGIPAVEAMRHARPVVATAVGGLNDVVIHEETGLLVPPEDARAFAEAALQLLRDDAAWRQMATAARKRYEIEFTLETMGARFAELLAHLQDDWERQQPLLAAAEGGVLSCTPGVSRWSDPLYLREFALLLEGDQGAMVWLETPRLEAGWNLRAEFFLGVLSAPDPDKEFGRLSLIDAEGNELAGRSFLGAVLGGRRWAILSLPLFPKRSAESARAVFRSSGTAGIRIARIELRRTSKAES